MREIKFRAWEREKKILHSVSELIFCAGPNLDGKGIQFYGPGVGKGWIDGENIILMQYTGLKDRNGKEIYEGDIIHEPDYSGGAVIFGGSQPGKRFVVEYEIGDSIGKKAGFNLRIGFVNGLYKGEVIGNIYVNPERLEAN